MEKEFNLSEKRKEYGTLNSYIKKGYFEEEDVKEFVRRLKQIKFSKFCKLEENGDVLYSQVEHFKEIDKLAGDKLVEDK